MEAAIRQAAALRAREGYPLDGQTIHHWEAGPQYTSVRFAESLLLAGMVPSVGSVGDAYDSALAETTIGLYKNECIRADSPLRRGRLTSLSDVETITAHWYNTSRLMHRLGRRAPVEHGIAYRAQYRDGQPVDHT